MGEVGSGACDLVGKDCHFTLVAGAERVFLRCVECVRWCVLGVPMSLAQVSAACLLMGGPVTVLLVVWGGASTGCRKSS